MLIFHKKKVKHKNGRLKSINLHNEKFDSPPFMIFDNFSSEKITKIIYIELN